jgi:hypothetical protein
MHLGGPWSQRGTAIPDALARDIEMNLHSLETEPPEIPGRRQAESPPGRSSRQPLPFEAVVQRMLDADMSLCHLRDDSLSPEFRIRS